MAHSVDKNYLTRQLSLDPRSAAARIVLQRNEQLGLTSARQSATAEGSAQDAKGVRSKLETIRNQFWTLPLEELHSQLSAIDLRSYPELAIVVEQLQQAAKVRDQFPRLAERLNGDLGLFHCVKQSVTMPPRDVAGMKESVMRALLIGENDKSYKATAKLIKEEFHEIYALQHEWFDDILKSKRLGRDTVARGNGFNFGAPIWVYVVLLTLFLRGCGMLMR